MPQRQVLAKLSVRKSEITILKKYFFREIFIGMNTDVSDAVLSEVLLANSLDKLEVLTIQACKKVRKESCSFAKFDCLKIRLVPR